MSQLACSGNRPMATPLPYTLHSTLLIPLNMDSVHPVSSLLTAPFLGAVAIEGPCDAAAQRRDKVWLTYASAQLTRHGTIPSLEWMNR